MDLHGLRVLKRCDIMEQVGRGKGALMQSKR